MQVDIENDANCAGLAGVWIGAAKENKDLIFVVWGLGIDGAEFGYMIICEKYGVFSISIF